MTAERMPSASAHVAGPRDGLVVFGLYVGARAARAGRAFDLWLARVPLIAVTFLAKLSVPPYNAVGLTLAIPLSFAAGAVGLLTGRMSVDVRRLAAFAFVFSLLWGIQVLRGEAYSVTSMLLMMVLHLPYVLFMRRQPAAYAEVLAAFQSVAMFIGACGIVQYFIQFGVGPALAFPLENYFPRDFMVSAFNKQGYLEYGAAIFRSNGVFMLEPSFFSQLMALAIVVELITTRRVIRLALLGAALIVSFSGTGLILLAVSILALAIAQRRWGWLVLAVLIGMLLFAIIASGSFRDTPYVGIFIKRAGEFTSIGSSGFARFVGGIYLFEQFLWPDPLRGLFGYGAGSIDTYLARATYAGGGNAIYKMVFEFGIVGGLAYLGFLVYCVASSAAPTALKVAVSMTYLLSGIYIPFAHGLALYLLMWPGGRSNEAALR
jgi:hypothetical protein